MINPKKKYPSQNISKIELINVITTITSKDVVNTTDKKELIKQLLILQEQELLKYFDKQQLKYLEKSLKRKELLPVFLSREEILKLIESCNSYQDKLMLKFALHTGCRINELVNIKTNNIDFSNKTVRIKGKGNKDRYIYIADTSFLQELRSFKADKFNIDEFLFMNNRNKPFKKRSLQKKIKSIAKRAGIDPVKVSWHKLRHSYGVFSIEKGIPVSVLAKQMGHSNASTTLIYTRITDDMVKKIYDRLNPTNLIDNKPTSNPQIPGDYFCHQCGSKFSGEDKFCSNCGSEQKY